MKIALEFLKEGESYTVGDLRLGISSTNGLIITGWSKYLNFSNLTKYNSLEEMEYIKNIFNKMVKTSIPLKKFIGNKTIEYVLCFDDGGKASIDICTEKNGKISWEIEIK